jgi:acyl-CoA-dependent ceramide synthase
MISWVLARHVGYLTVCYSVYRDTSAVMPSACFRETANGREGPLPTPTDRGIMYLAEPLYDSEGLMCFNESVKWNFLVVLLMLQGLMLVWLMAIIRVAVKVIRGTGAEDTRSDDEDNEAEEEECDEYAEGTMAKAGAVEAAIATHGGKTSYDDEGGGDDQPIEEEVGVEDIDLKGWGRRAGLKRQASTSTGVSLPGHSDRKELLGRIGCEKQVE